MISFYFPLVLENWLGRSPKWIKRSLELAFEGNWINFFYTITKALIHMLSSSHNNNGIRHNYKNANCINTLFNLKRIEWRKYYLFILDKLNLRGAIFYLSSSIPHYLIAFDFRVEWLQKNVYLKILPHMYISLCFSSM